MTPVFLASCRGAAQRRVGDVGARRHLPPRDVAHVDGQILRLEPPTDRRLLRARGVSGRTGAREGCAAGEAGAPRAGGLRDLVVELHGVGAEHDTDPLVDRVRQHVPQRLRVVERLVAPHQHAVRGARVATRARRAGHARSAGSCGGRGAAPVEVAYLLEGGRALVREDYVDVRAARADELGAHVVPVVAEALRAHHQHRKRRDVPRHLQLLLLDPVPQYLARAPRSAATSLNEPRAAAMKIDKGKLGRNFIYFTASVSRISSPYHSSVPTRGRRVCHPPAPRWSAAHTPLRTLERSRRDRPAPKLFPSLPLQTESHLSETQSLAPHRGGRDLGGGDSGAAKVHVVDERLHLRRVQVQVLLPEHIRLPRGFCFP